MTRGPGKFKTKRGGGRSFSRNLVLNEDGIAVSSDKWTPRSRRDRDDDDDDEDEDSDDEEKKIEEEEEESEEEEEEDQLEPGAVAGPSDTSSAPIEQSRAERRAEKRQKKQPQVVAEEDRDLVNPNRLPVKSMAISDIAAPRELSRREREAKEKEEAKARYWKLHQAGKTTEAKSDLARLAKIRQEREAAAKARKEDEAKAAATEATKRD